MLWHAQHGAQAPKNREVLAKRGAPIPDYMWPPKDLPGVGPWFTAFWELSTERRYMGGPIPMSAIASFPTDDPEGFADAMRSADRAYLEFLSRPAEERASLPVAGPGLFRGKSND